MGRLTHASTSAQALTLLTLRQISADCPSGPTAPFSPTRSTSASSPSSRPSPTTLYSSPPTRPSARQRPARPSPSADRSQARSPTGCVSSTHRSSPWLSRPLRRFWATPAWPRPLAGTVSPRARSRRRCGAIYPPPFHVGTLLLCRSACAHSSVTRMRSLCHAGAGLPDARSLELHRPPRRGVPRGNLQELQHVRPRHARDPRHCQGGDRRPGDGSPRFDGRVSLPAGLLARRWRVRGDPKGDRCGTTVRGSCAGGDDSWLLPATCDRGEGGRGGEGAAAERNASVVGGDG